MTHVPPPPSDTPTEPDKWTQKSPELPKPAGGRGDFSINLWVIRFSTDDRLQGAAIFFGVLLFFAWLGLVLTEALSSIADSKAQFLDKAQPVLWSGFLVALGVAIGRGKDDKEK
jgi:hypothetical protein